MSQRTTKFTIDSEDFDKGIYLDITLSYTWCEGCDASEHSPAEASHPESLRFTDVVVVVAGSRFVSEYLGPRLALLNTLGPRLALLNTLNAMLDDKAFYERAVECCCKKEADDHETALAERDEARAGDRS